MRLNEICDNPGASKPRMRVGRGIGSGKGKTAGRGIKGQKARTGVAVKGFEGGQMPLHRRLPKRGFKNPEVIDLNEINIGRIQYAVDARKLDRRVPITVEALVRAGLCAKMRDGVKILGMGELKTALTFVVTAVSQSARAEIERLGGSIEIVPSIRKFDQSREVIPARHPPKPVRASPDVVPFREVAVARGERQVGPTGTHTATAVGGEKTSEPVAELKPAVTDGAEDPATTGVANSPQNAIVDGTVSPQELLASMRSASTKDRDRREAAIRETARMLATKDEGTVEVKDRKRRELLPLAKELVRKVFRDDAGEARQAAYALVASSEAYKGTLNPTASVSQLTPAELDMFSRGLTGLLTELKIPCVSKVRAYSSGASSSGHPLITVAVTLSRALSFEISGQRFLMRPPEVKNPKTIAVTVGCPIAEELVSATNDHPAGAEGVLVENRSLFVMPVDSVKDEIPISFVTPWSLENRLVAVETAPAVQGDSPAGPGGKF